METMVLAAVFLVAAYLKQYELCMWFGVFLLVYGCLPESARTVLMRIFDNPVARYMGKISYSFYLSHLLVMYAVIYALSFVIDPVESPLVFYGWGLPLLLSGATLVSMVTYRYIEKPFIAWSNKKAVR